jgi:hypothetical protein
MPTTVYADVNDDKVSSQADTTYSNAAESAGSLSTNPGFRIDVGQQTFGGAPTYVCEEALFYFATESVDGNSGTLSLYGAAGTTLDVNFTLEVRFKDWGSTPGTEDWVPASSLGGLTLAGSMNTSGWNSSGYNDIAVDCNALAATRYLLNSSRHRLLTTPTGSEYVQITEADNAGTTQDAKLTVTTAPPVQLPSPLGLFDQEIVLGAVFDRDGFA